jgi:phage baseplate assembly protein W
MIEQLLFTNPGERVNRPDFGSGVLQLVFAPGSEELASGLQFTVQASLQRWLGDVILVEQVAALAEGERLFIEIVYTLRRTGDERREVFAGSVIT